MRSFLVSIALVTAVPMFGQSTINPSQVRGTAVVQTPSSPQSIAQADVKVLNGALNPLLFNGADIGAKINAAFAYCSKSCQVIIPAGTYNYATSITMDAPAESLLGAGSEATILNYSGSSDAIKWQMNPFTIAKAGTLKGMTINCTPAATNCIRSGTIVGSTSDDLVVKGATGAGSAAILLENTAPNGFSAWTERNTYTNIHLGDASTQNTYGIRLAVNGGDGSFGFNNWDGLWANLTTNQIAFFVDSNAVPYGPSTIKLQANMDGNGTGMEVVRVAGNAARNIWQLSGEVTGGSDPNQAKAIHVMSTGAASGFGYVSVGCPGGTGCLSQNDNTNGDIEDLNITPSPATLTVQMGGTTITNWIGSGQTVKAYPLLNFGLGIPYLGGFGMVDNGTIRAPFVGLSDTGTFCVNRINVGTANMGPFSYIWCTDKDGNTKQIGTGLSTASIFTGNPPVVSTGQLSMGSQVVAASNCNAGGTITGVVGCIVTNIAGTNRYVPFF